jgi:hypothetical protein
MISACAGPQLKRDDLLIEPAINKVVSNEKQITLYVEIFGVAKTIANPNTVGEARTGILNAPTPILAQDPIHLIITDQIKKAFLGAGFKLVEKETAHFTISGRIERFWVNERAGAWSENTKASVKYDLIIKDKQGRFLWGDNIVGRATSKNRMDATKDDVPTLIVALRNSIESIFRNESFWKAFEQ